MNKKFVLIGFAVSILLIPIASAQLSAYYDDDIFWNNIDDFWYWLDILLERGNWTMQNLNLSHVKDCSQALETDANGRIYCGTDAVGGAGVGLWQVIDNWMSGNASAGGTQKINITDINTSRLYVFENATFEKDVIINGTLYGGSPVKVSGGLNLTDGIYTGNGSGLTDLNLTNITFSGGNITANYFFGKLSCNYIYNGSDSDFCADNNTFWNIIGSQYMENRSGILDVNEAELNNTIDLRINSTTFTPNNVTTIYGTLDSGNLTSIQFIEDGDSYNVSEIAGINPLEIIINFTGIDTFDSILLSVWYSGGLGHEIELQLFHYPNSAWETKAEITDMSGFTQSIIPVFDPDNHVNATNVTLRFIHIQNGISAHDFFIDYIALQKGTTTLTSSDHDSLGGRDSITNHPWALPINGSRSMTGDLNMGGNNIFNLGNEFNQSYIDGNRTNAEIWGVCSNGTFPFLDQSNTFTGEQTFNDNVTLSTIKLRSGANHLDINPDASGGVYLFENASSGEYPEFRIYSNFDGVPTYTRLVQLNSDEDFLIQNNASGGEVVLSAYLEEDMQFASTRTLWMPGVGSTATFEGELEGSRQTLCFWNEKLTADDWVNSNGVACSGTVCFRTEYAGSLRGLHVVDTTVCSTLCVGSTISVRINGGATTSLSVTTSGGSTTEELSDSTARGTDTFNAGDTISIYYDENGLQPLTSIVLSACVEVQYNA